MRVPPLFWVNLNAFQLHAEVDVIAACHSRSAALAHHLAALHHVAFVNIYFAQMAVDSLQAIAMVNDDAVAVNAKRRGIDYPAVV